MEQLAALTVKVSEAEEAAAQVGARRHGGHGGRVGGRRAHMRSHERMHACTRTMQVREEVAEGQRRIGELEQQLDEMKEAAAAMEAAQQELQVRRAWGKAHKAKSERESQINEAVIAMPPRPLLSQPLVLTPAALSVPLCPAGLRQRGGGAHHSPGGGGGRRTAGARPGSAGGSRRAGGSKGALPTCIHHCPALRARTGAGARSH